METKIIREDFDCRNVAEIVTLTKTISIHRSSRTGEIDSEIPTYTNCSHASACGVGKKSGNSINYDWSRCVLQKLK